MELVRPRPTPRPGPPRSGLCSPLLTACLLACGTSSSTGSRPPPAALPKSTSAPAAPAPHPRSPAAAPAPLPSPGTRHFTGGAPERQWHRADDPRPDILVITLCSVRPDHLGPWGHPGNSPVIDALAATGTTFDHAWSNATFTLPAHASLLTGLTPSRAGVMESSDKLAASPPTLPEVLHAYGYTTVAWSTVATATSFRKGDGLERGFDHFFEGGNPRDQRVWYDALASDGRPWFSVVHFKNAHHPYRVRRTGDDPRLVAWAYPPLGVTPPRDPDEVLAEQVRADPPLATALGERYDDAIRADDAEIGTLLQQLDARGMLEHAVVIVVGDHGESLGEDPAIGHQQLTPTVTAIPLVMSPPAGTSWPAHITADAGLADLFPTVLGLAGAKVPPGIDGVDLAPALAGRADPERVVVAQALRRVGTPGAQPQRYAGLEAVIRWPWWLSHGTDSRTPTTLYRLDSGTPTVTNDPGALRALLDARATLAPVGAIPTEARPVTDAERKAIQQAGYW